MMPTITLADGVDADRVYIFVNGRRMSVAAVCVMDAKSITKVYARDCTSLTSLDLPAATYVYAGGCTSLDGAIFAGKDERNYDFVGLRLRGEWRVLAGCRNFSPEDARFHWGSNSRSANPECLALAEKLIAQFPQASE